MTQSVDMGLRVRSCSSGSAVGVDVVTVVEASWDGVAGCAA